MGHVPHAYTSVARDGRKKTRIWNRNGRARRSRRCVAERLKTRIWDQGFNLASRRVTACAGCRFVSRFSAQFLVGSRLQAFCERRAFPLFVVLVLFRNSLDAANEA